MFHEMHLKYFLLVYKSQLSVCLTGELMVGIATRLPGLTAVVTQA